MYGSKIFRYHEGTEGKKWEEIDLENPVERGKGEKGIEYYHGSMMEDVWPVDMIVLEGNKKNIWFPMMYYYRDWEELTMYVYEVMNTFFLRIFLFDDERIDNNHKYQYGRYKYNRTCYFQNHANLSRIFNELVLSHHHFEKGLNPVDCWIAWTLRLHLPVERKYRIPIERNMKLHAEVEEEEDKLTRLRRKEEISRWDTDVAMNLERRIKRWTRWRRYKSYGLMGVILLLIMFVLHSKMPSL